MATWNLDGVRHLVLVCMGSSCRKHGADGVLAAFKAEVKAAGLREEVHLARARCLGRCDDACNVLHATDGCWYGEVTARQARTIVHEHLQGGAPVERLVTYRTQAHRLRATGRGAKGKSKG
jgi:(2Fe-2S) ferredoxin